MYEERVKRRPWGSSRESRRGLDLIKTAYNNSVCQQSCTAVGYGNGAHCYAELAVSSPAVAETIASTYCIYSRRDGQPEWAWVARKISGRYNRQITNRARRCWTSLMRPTPLQLYAWIFYLNSADGNTLLTTVPSTVNEPVTVSAPRQPAPFKI